MNDAKFDHFYLFPGKLKKDLDGYKVDLNFKNGIIRGRRLIPGLKAKSLEFHNLYINNHFKEIDFQNFLLYKLLFDENFLKNYNLWKVEDLHLVREMFTEKQLKKDEEFLLNVSKKANMNDLTKFFNINTDGDSLIVSFMMKKLISPLLVIKYQKLFNVNVNENNEHMRIRKIIKIYNKIGKVGE